MRNPFKGDFRITQVFGVNPQTYARFGLRAHNGIDYALPLGTHVLAPHSGTVLEATFDSTGYGWYIKIENNEEGSVLAHFKTLKVKVGDKVYEGQLVGYSGNSGNSTGPHLHWGFYKFPRNRQNGYAGFINQKSLITTQPVTKPQDDLKQQLKDNIELSKKLGKERDKLNKVIEGKDDEIEKMEIDFNKKYKLLQNERDSALSLKKIECQEKIESVTIRLSTDFDKKKLDFEKTISDLEKKPEKNDEVVVKPQPRPRKLIKKIEAILDIIFRT